MLSTTEIFDLMRTGIEETLEKNFEKIFTKVDSLGVLVDWANTFFTFEYKSLNGSCDIKPNRSSGYDVKIFIYNRKKNYNENEIQELINKLENSIMPKSEYTITVTRA